MGIWFPRITHTLLKRRHALAPGCFSADRCRDAVFCLARSYFWDLSPNKSSHLIFLVWGVMKVRCDDKQPLGLQISWAESLKRPAKMLGIETDYLGVCKCSIIRKLVEVSLFVSVLYIMPDVTELGWFWSNFLSDGTLDISSHILNICLSESFTLSPVQYVNQDVFMNWCRKFALYFLGKWKLEEKTNLSLTQFV